MEQTAMAEHLDIDWLVDRDRQAKAVGDDERSDAPPYQALFVAMAEGLVFVDRHGRVAAINPAAEKLLGIEAATLLGRSSLLPDAPLTDDEVTIAEADLPWERTRQTGIGRAEVVLGTRRPDGSPLWLSVNCEPLDPQGMPPHAVVITFRDVTQQRALEQHLQMTRVALDSVQDCAFLMERERVLHVNRAASRSLGYTKEELVGKTVFDFDPLATPELFEELLKAHSRDAPLIFESAHRTKDGRVFPVEVEVSPFTFDSRHLAIALTRDITERKRNDNALRRLNRTLQTLSSGNEALVRACSERELLERMCRILVDVGGYRVVWIQLNRSPGDRDLFPAAVASTDCSLAADPARMPTGNALWNALTGGEPELIEDIHHDNLSAECCTDLIEAGCTAGLVLPLIAGTGLIGALSIFAENASAFDKAELELLKELANDLAFGIQVQRTHGERQQAVARLQQTMEATIVALANTLELRDPYTAGHQRRVAQLAKAVALRIGIDAERAEAIYLAGMIHDIGKIYVPSEVLTRPGRLTLLEYSLVQTHVEAAYGILQPIDFPWPLADIVRQHHERLDGSGYPRGIRGEEISLDARILAVADVVEAMSMHRPYRPGLGIDAALAEIESGRDCLYDATVVDGCLALFREDGFRFD